MAAASERISSAGAPTLDPLSRRYATQILSMSGVFGLGALLAFTSLKIPLICPLRLATGVPCPLCGMTTGTTALLRGDLSGAASANPLALVFAPLMGSMLVDRIRRLIGRLPDIEFTASMRRGLLITAAVALSSAWVFELFRFGVL